MNEAVRTASLYWAGRFFPMIPTSPRLPALWRSHRARKDETAATIRDGYINCFDPDVLVNFAGATLGATHKGIPVVAPSDLTAGIRTERRVEYGIGINEVAAHFSDKELKYARTDPVGLMRTIPKGPSKLFLGALFGAIADAEWDGLFRETRVGSRFAPTHMSIATMGELDLERSISLGRLSGYDLRFHRPPSDLYGGRLFLLDASRPEDVFDYWNLRALGHNILPLPIQALSNKAWLDRCRSMARTNRRPPERENGWWGGTLLLKSRGLAKERLTEAFEALDLPKTPKGEGPYLTIQHWYPRLWITPEREWDESKAATFKSGEVTQDFTDARESIRLVVPAPSVATEHLYGATPRYACELYTRVWSNDGTFAEVIPEGGDKVERCINSIPFEGIRLTRRGPVALCRSDRDVYHLKVPQATELITAWMAERGLEAAPSGEGRIAQSALRQINGPWGTGLLTVPGVIEAIVDMSGGSHRTHKALRDGLLQARGQATRGMQPNEVIRALASKDILRLGMEIPCSSCGKAGWYSLEDCTYSLECVKCTAAISVGEVDPESLKLAYSSIGAFRADKSTRGVLPLLLVMRFAHLVMRAAVTSSTSLTLKGKGIDNEVDLCLFYRDDLRDPEWGEGGYDLILCECKNEMPFEEVDFRRMRQLRRLFPSAILCFATLRDKLSTTEIRELKGMAERGRRGLGERPDGPLMILTRTELLHHLPPPLCWDESARTRGRGGLMEVCDATLVRHLGLEPWDQERVKRIRAKFPDKPVGDR